MFKLEMKTTRLVSLLTAILTTSFVTQALADDLSPMIEGKDLTAWKVPDPNPFWKVENGVLIGESDKANKGSMLWTKKSYQDFIIEFEARWSGEIDSGVLFRKSENRKRELQMQLGISRSQRIDLTGSFYTGGKEKYPESGRVKDLKKFIKPDAWNKYRLEAKGHTFTVWLNGKKAVQYTSDNFPYAGPIGLQIHPGLHMKIEFRNIRFKSLD